MGSPHGAGLDSPRRLVSASRPVRTKDLADTIANVIWTLLHERSDEVFAALAGLPRPAPNLEDCPLRYSPTMGSATSGKGRPSEPGRAATGEPAGRKEW